MSGTRVLVVDDEAFIQQLIGEVLRTEGYDVTAVSNAEEALPIALREPFDLVLTDVDLPGLDGLELIGQLRANDPNLTTMVVTGHGSLELALQALQVGAQGFILKPFPIENLRQTVRETLEKGRLARENLRLRALLPLFELNEQRINELDLPQLLALILQIVQREFRAAAAWISLGNRQSGAQRIEAARGLAEPLAEPGWPLASLLPAGLGTQTAQVRLTAEQVGRLPPLAAPLEDGLCLAVVPLLVKGRPIGALVLVRDDRTSSLNASDLDLLALFAGQAASAIENVRLYSAQKQNAEVSATLLALAQSITTIMTPETVAEELARRLHEVLGSERYGLWLPNEDASEFRLARVGPNPDQYNDRPGQDSLKLSDRSLTQGGPILIEDAEVDAGKLAQIFWLWGVRAALAIPLLSRQRTYGWLTFEFGPTPRRFDETERAIVHGVNNLARLALENAALYAETQDTLNRLDLLYNVSKTVSGPADLNGVFDAILEASSIMSTDSASIFVVDENEGALKLRASRNLSRAQGSQFRLGEGIVGWVAQHGELVNVADTVSDSRYYQTVPDYGSRSILAIPLRAGGKVVAVLSLARYHSNGFTDDDTRLAEIIASHAAQALKNAQLYENTRRLAWEQLLLYEIAKTINAATTVPALVSGVAPLLTQIGNAEGGAILLINPETGKAEVVGKFGEIDVPAPKPVTWRPGRSRGRTPVGAALAALAETPATRAGYRLLLPLVLRGESLGTLILQRSAAGQPFSRDEEDLVTSVAHQVAVAIENLRLRAQSITVFQELSQVPGARLSLAHLADRILDKVLELFPCLGGSLVLQDRQSFQPRVIAAAGPVAEALQRVRWDHDPRWYERLRGRGTVLEALNQTGEPFVELGEQSGVDYLLFAPMQAEARSLDLGAIVLAYDQEVPDDERRHLLASLVSQATLVVRNAQLYLAAHESSIAEERARIAREIHDGVAQNLAHLMIKTEIIARLADRNLDAAKAELAYSRQVLETSVTELRRCIYALRPIEFEERGLYRALEKLVNDFAEQDEVKVHLHTGEKPGLSADAEAAIFRMVQEALNNVRKHARARTIEVALDVERDGMHVTIEDDGQGFDRDGVAGEREGHFGLVQMRERAEELGGRLRIHSGPGRGTRLEIVLPLTSRESARGNGLN